MNNKIKINTHSSFQPLKTVLLGQTFDHDYFHWIKDPKIKDPLTRILEETHEDLDNMKTTLNKHGVEVVQPDPIKANAEEQFTNDLKQVMCVPMYKMGMRCMKMRSVHIPHLDRYENYLGRLDKIIYKIIGFFYKIYAEHRQKYINKYK